jgi:hypothetical protein
MACFVVLEAYPVGESLPWGPKMNYFTRFCCVLDPDLIRIHRIHMFLGLPDPDPLVRGMDPAPDPDCSSSCKNSKKTLTPTIL